MKILVVSDMVSQALYSERIKTICKDVQFIISCGDLPFNYLEYIVTMLNKPLYYVFGNHHTYQLIHDNTVKTHPLGCENIDQKIIRHKGVLIGGLEGSMLYNNKAYQYTEWQMSAKINRMAPKLYWNKFRNNRPIDILVTHAPPYQIQDGNPIDVTGGFKAFVKFMNRYKPKYLIHGHTHNFTDDKDVVAFGATTVIKCMRI